MSDPRPMPTRKPRTRLAPSERNEIFVEVLTGQATQREAAEKFGVDRSTVVHVCRVAKQCATEVDSDPGPKRRRRSRPPAPRPRGSGLLVVIDGAKALSAAVKAGRLRRQGGVAHTFSLSVTAGTGLASLGICHVRLGGPVAGAVCVSKDLAPSAR